jgi:putative endonuclease
MAIFKLQKNSVGQKGEKEAVKFLKKQGYKILDRNWCNEKGKRIGEIDVVVQNKKTGQIIFVEVKTRFLDKYDKSVLPQEQITHLKLIKLNKIAEVYIKEKFLLDIIWRIDAVGVIFTKENKKPIIKHIKSIFL